VQVDSHPHAATAHASPTWQTCLLTAYCQGISSRMAALCPSEIVQGSQVSLCHTPVHALSLAGTWGACRLRYRRLLRRSAHRLLPTGAFFFFFNRRALLKFLARVLLVVNWTGLSSFNTSTCGKAPGLECLDAVLYFGRCVKLTLRTGVKLLGVCILTVDRPRCPWVLNQFVLWRESVLALSRTCGVFSCCHFCNVIDVYSFRCIPSNCARLATVGTHHPGNSGEIRGRIAILPSISNFNISESLS
jgi:hypothetical protein